MEEARERYARYLNRRYGGRSTPYHYLRDLEMFIQQVGTKEPRSVTVADIDDFVDAQVERGLKASSINRRVASLHTFFEYLASEAPDEIWPNPVNRRRHCLKEGFLLPRDVSDPTIAALFAVIDDVRDRAIFGLMIGAGLRVGEVINVQLSGLESAPSPEQAARLRVMGKGQKERIVWLTPYWAEIVEQWVEQRPEVEHDYLFVNQHDRPLSVAGVQFRLREYNKTAGVSVTCHQLRHTFARRLAEERMPIESIGKLLGHRQLATTLLYTAGADPDLRDSFLASMAQPMPSDSLPSETPPSETLSPAPRRQEEKADPQALEKAIARLDPLPEWLRSTLTTYLRFRWRNWQPHRAAPNVDTLSRQLVRIWGWLLTKYPLTQWASLQRSQVECWLDALTEQGLKANTRRSLLSVLFGCLHYALDQELPVAPNLFRIPYPKRSDPLPRFLKPDDYQRIIDTVLEHTATDAPRHRLDRTWFLTLLHTGIRTCELLDLRLSDVDLAGKRLWIHVSKNQHARTVYITPELSAALSAYLAQRPQTGDDHLWIDKGEPLCSARVRYCFERWSKLAQVNVSAHRLRHTLATYLINQGMSLLAIAKLLGHRSLSTTQQYARLFEPTVKLQFLEAMSNIEGIPSLDWPIQPLFDSVQVEQIFDSM